MIGLRKIDGGALAEKVRSMGRARPLKEEAAKDKGARRARFGGRRLREGLKVVSGFDSYVPWAGADATYARIAAAGKLGELEDWLEEIYPNGIDETALNDLLWFDRDEVLSAMGLSDDISEGVSEGTEKDVEHHGPGYLVFYWKDGEAESEFDDSYDTLEDAKEAARGLIASVEGIDAVEIDNHDSTKVFWRWDGSEFSEPDEDEDDMGESLASVTAAAEAPTANGKASEGVSEGVAEMNFAVSGNGFEPSSEDDDVGSFVGF